MDTLLKIGKNELQVECFVVTDSEGKKTTTLKKDFKEKYKGVPGFDTDNVYDLIVERQKQCGLIDHPKSKKKKGNEEGTESTSNEA